MICAGGVYYSDSSSVPRSNLIHTLSIDKVAAHDFRVVTAERIIYRYHSDKGTTHSVTSGVAALCLTQSRAYVDTSYLSVYPRGRVTHSRWCTPRCLRVTVAAAGAYTF